MMENRAKPELTCISEEGIADMDLPDHILEELDYLGDCITSCDKVENYLMMSEYENNLVKTADFPLLDRRLRKRLMSLRGAAIGASGNNFVQESNGNSLRRDSLIEVQNALAAQAAVGQLRVLKNREGHSDTPGVHGQAAPLFPGLKNSLKSGNFRTISVIEEASV